MNIQRWIKNLLQKVLCIEKQKDYLQWNMEIYLKNMWYGKNKVDSMN